MREFDADELPAGIDLESCPCPLGCSAASKEVLLARDRLHDLPGRFHIVKCSGCQLMRTDPRPTPATMGYYYPADYGPHRSDHSDPGSRPSRLRDLARSLVNFKTETIPDLPPGRLLEIGCASGNFLAKMASQGWQVRGIEFVEAAALAAHARGFEVDIGRIEDQPESQDRFDLIAAWMVVEHLHEPLAALSKLCRLTVPGGWLAISVPNAGNWDFRLFGENWFATQVPTHLFHYTPATISKLLKEAGWHVETIASQRILSEVPASVANVIADAWPKSDLVRRLRRRLQNPTLVQNLGIYPFAAVAALFGLTGRMTILARKPD